MAMSCVSRNDTVDSSGGRRPRGRLDGIAGPGFPVTAQSIPAGPMGCGRNGRLPVIDVSPTHADNSPLSTGKNLRPLRCFVNRSGKRAPRMHDPFPGQ